MSRRLKTCIIGLALWAAADVVLSGGALAADSGDLDQVSQLLLQAKNQASQVRSDVSTIDFFALSRSSWESHGSIVNLYKEHINALQRVAAKLEEARNIASPVQKTVIDRIMPLMKELASNSEALIANAGKDVTALRTSAGGDYFKANSDLAAELAALISNHVNYAQTKQALDRLSQQLDLPQR